MVAQAASRPRTKSRIGRRASRATPGWCSGSGAARTFQARSCRPEASAAIRAAGGAASRWPAPFSGSFPGLRWPASTRVARQGGCSRGWPGSALAPAAVSRVGLPIPQQARAWGSQWGVPQGSCEGRYQHQGRCRLGAVAENQRSSISGAELSRSGPPVHAATGGGGRHLSTLHLQAVGWRRPSDAHQTVELLGGPGGGGGGAPVACAERFAAAGSDHQKGAGLRGAFLASPGCRQFIDPGVAPVIF